MWILKSRFEYTCVSLMVFRGLTIRRTKVEARVMKLKTRNVAGKDEVTGEMIKGDGDIVVECI